MKTEEDKLYTDFQGQPVYRMTLEEMLPKMGFEKIDTMGFSYWRIREDNPLLKQYPVVYHDDGMGYSPTTEYIIDTYVDATEPGLILWADTKVEKE